MSNIGNWERRKATDGQKVEVGEASVKVTGWQHQGSHGNGGALPGKMEDRNRRQQCDAARQEVTTQVIDLWTFETETITNESLGLKPGQWKIEINGPN